MELQCEFKPAMNNPSRMISYGCGITSTKIFERGTLIKSVKGRHFSDKNDKEVTVIAISGTTLHYVPRGFNCFFPSVTVLKIIDCGLKEISREDLVGLSTLTGIYLDENELISLPNNLFHNMLNLKEVSFANNRIKYMSSQLLLPIANKLTMVDFRGNDAMNADFGTEAIFDTLQGLMNEIDKKCTKPEQEKISPPSSQHSEIFRQAWETGRFADMLVTAGEKEFLVSKVVLSFKSHVISSLIDDTTNKLKLQGFTAAAVETFLCYLYTNKIQDETCAIQVFEMATKFDVPDLRIEFEKIMMNSLDESNAVQIYALGHIFDAELMKESALKHIKKSLPGVEITEELKSNIEGLKELVEAKRSCKLMLQETESEGKVKMEEIRHEAKRKIDEVKSAIKRKKKDIEDD